MTVDNYYKINMLEQKLLEEVNRFNAINRYAKNMIMEQEAPPPPPPVNDTEPAQDAPGLDALASPDAPGLDTPPPAPEVSSDEKLVSDTPAEDTEEVDVTELVDMVKNLKKDFEGNQQNSSDVTTKMDDVFSKLGELEQKLASMDQLMSKIDELGNKVQEMKPTTPQEKLEMRSLDSYPFNQKPQEFFSNKQAEMKQSGKNEYVLTQDDVKNFSVDNMKTSFNPIAQEDEYSF